MTYSAPNTNPFDQSGTEYEPQQLPLDEIIRLGIAKYTMGLRVCLPAQVTAIRGEQEVDVQPSLQTRYKDGRLITLPPIQKVPVSMPVGNDYYVKVPVAVGDTGMLIFSDRSLDVWLAGSGGVVDPQDVRQHDLSDAVFVPGLVPFSKQTHDGTNDLVLKNGRMVVKVQKAGTIAASNGTNELMDVLDRITKQAQLLAQTLSVDTVNTWTGPTQLNSFLQYALISNTLLTLIAKLETLKGTP